jgi:CheY-like chemotaxis protein
MFAETRSKLLVACVSGANYAHRTRGNTMGRKALVVDDSPTVRQVQKLLMHREGYQVFTAEDGFEAFRIARTELPDVVLLDVAMPRMDGVECCRRIKKDQELAGATVIMVTGKEELKQLREAYAAGCDGYLVKPVQESNLEKEMSKLGISKEATVQ